MRRTTIQTEYPCLKQFDEWVQSASPNDKFTYHIGENLSGSIIGEVIQKYTFQYAKKGKIYLVQQRYDNRQFKYIAVKASTKFASSLVPVDYVGFPTAA